MTISRPAATAPLWTRQDFFALATVLAAACLLLWPDLFRGWAPPDEGGLAQVAERVLRGEMPHRDFDDPWTGGWSYFQAAVFRFFGTRLSLVRVPLFLAWLAGIIAAYRLMRRVASPALAGGVALACALWSLFAWRFPLLGWYYSPVALATCWCAVRFVESQRRAWLVAAGVLIGILLLVKITAVFLLAALLLWALVVASEAGDGEAAGPYGFVVVVAALLAAFLAGVFLLLRGLPAEMQGAASLHFLLPQLLVAAWMIRRAARSGTSVVTGMRKLLRLTVPLFAGIVLAIAPYVGLFALHHELPALFLGVFIKPGVRLAGFALGPPGRLGTVLALLAPLLLIAACRFVRQEGTRRELVFAILCGAGMGALAFVSETTASAVALCIRAMPIVLPLAAFWLQEPAMETASSRSVVVLLVLAAVTAQLSQIPYSAHAYFLYVAPLGILATVSLLRSRMSAAPVAAFWTAMLLVSGMEPLTSPEESLHALPMRRGGIEVSFLDSARYARMAEYVARQPDGPIVVLGDHPELPFLLERPSGSRMIYDVIADSADVSPRGLLADLSSAGVRTIVIAHRGGARGERDAPQIDALREAFPCGTWIGRFELRSRYPEGAASAASSPACAVQAAIVP